MLSDLIGKYKTDMEQYLTAHAMEMGSEMSKVDRNYKNMEIKANEVLEKYGACQEVMCKCDLHILQFQKSLD